MKLKKLFVAFAAVFVFSSLHSVAEAATIHTVQNGDTFWNIAVKYGVPYKSLKAINNNHADLIKIGEKLTIPSSPYTAAEKDLLSRLIEAEAKGEPYAGKVAVGTVVLNRVGSKEFPNTIKSVIYQTTNSHYAFTPVSTGSINKAASVLSKQAANEAIVYQGMGGGSLFFYNPKIATSTFMKNRPVTTVIGNHVFTK